MRARTGHGATFSHGRGWTDCRPARGHRHRAPLADEPPAGTDETFAAYLRAKTLSEEDPRGRDLDRTVLRPGGLTDDPGTGRVTLAPSVDRGSVPRDDVAAVLAALLDAPGGGVVLELVSGPTPVAEAVSEVAARG